MRDTIDDVMGGRQPLAELVGDDRFPYGDRRQARAFLDELGVPFVTIRRERFYKPDDIRTALDRATKMRPRKPSDPHETGPPITA